MAIAMWVPLKSLYLLHVAGVPNLFCAGRLVVTPPHKTAWTLTPLSFRNLITHCGMIHDINSFIAVVLSRLS